MNFPVFKFNSIKKDNDNLSYGSNSVIEIYHDADLLVR